MLKKFVLEIEGDKLESSFQEKLKEGLIKTFEDASVKVNVTDQEAADEEARKKAEEDTKNKEIKDKKIEELTQNFEAVNKLQGDKDKIISDLQAKIAELEAKLASGVEAEACMTKKCSEAEAQLAEVSKKFSEAEAKFAQMDKDAKTESIKTFVKQQITEGRVLPKDENIVVALMEQLDDKAVLKFVQDDKEMSTPMAEVIKKFICGLPKAVEFGELSLNPEHKTFDSEVSIGGVKYEVTDVELVQKAEKYAQENKVGFDVALLEVSKEVKQ